MSSECQIKYKKFETQVKKKTKYTDSLECKQIAGSKFVYWLFYFRIVNIER